MAPIRYNLGMRWAIVWLVLAGAAAPATTAHADRRAKRSNARATVAILPLTWTDESLSIYSNAVASALAVELRSVEGIRVESVPLSGTIPDRVALVVGGRIVASGKKAERVSVELVVRDPEFSITVATIASDVAPLGEIETLISKMGQKLETVVARGLRDHDKRIAEREKPIRLRPTVVKGEGDRDSPPDPDTDTAASAQQDRMVIMLATTNTDDAVVPVSTIATESGFRLAERLGCHPLAAPSNNAASHAEAAALAVKTGAVATVKLHVRDIDYDWVGVLTARGKVRVVVTAPDATVIFDRTVRTDTIVGSRGDRHAGVARMVLDQAMDIAAPVIRKELAK